MGFSENNLWDIFAIIIWSFIALAGIPIFASLTLGQVFDDQSQKLYQFYNNANVIIFLIGIMAISIASSSIPALKGILKIDVHNPRFTPPLPRSILLTIIVSAIFFLGFLSINLYTSDTPLFTQFAIPLIEQKALLEGGLEVSAPTNLGRLFFAVEPASFLETIYVFCWAILILFIWKLIKYILLLKISLPSIIDKSADYIIFIASFTIVGASLHIARYGASEQALVFTAFFWFFSGSIIAIWNSIFPAIILHESFNFVSALVLIYGVPTAKIVIFISMGILILIGYLYFRAEKEVGGVGISYG